MLGLGLGLARQTLLSRIIDANLVPVIDFTQWYNVPQSPMASTTTDTFTNSGTGYIQLDIGAEAGKTYTISIDQTRGAGTLLIYLASEQGVTQANQVYGLEGGAETIDLVADGPYLTFRASVGNTTTTVTSLRVVERDLDAELRALINSLYGQGQAGAFYIPKPEVLGSQVLFQDSAGTTPVTADGDPVGLMLDVSGNGLHLSQGLSSAKPTYRSSGGYSWLSFDGVDDSIMAQTPQSISVPYSISTSVAVTSNDTRVSSSTSDLNGQLVMRDNSYRIYNGAFLILFDTFTTENPHVVSAVFDGAASSISVSRGDDTGSVSGDSGAATSLSAIALGYRASGSTSYAAMDMYGYALTDYEMSESQAGAVREFYEGISP